jgi:DNA topoisomerase-3
LHHEVVAHFITSNTIFSGLCTAGEEGTKFKNRAFAENVLRDCVDSVAWLTSCSEEPIRPSPPQLYNLTDLQQQANIRHNLPKEKTREICQLLYDKGIITTPLTTSRLVCFNYFNKLDKILLALHSSMPGLVNRVFNSDYKPG